MAGALLLASVALAVGLVPAVATAEALEASEAGACSFFVGETERACLNNERGRGSEKES